MKMTKEYILECLKKYCNFDNVILHQNNFETLIINPLEEASCFHNWDYAHGVSKCVLIFYTLNFVVKIPFTGYEDENMETSSYEDGGGFWASYTEAHHTNGDLRTGFVHRECESEYFDFYCASFPKKSHGWDYCAVEEEISKIATQEGLGQLFAKTELLGVVGNNNYPIYIQERCITYDDYATTDSGRDKSTSRTDKDYKVAKTLRDKYDLFFEDDWLLDFILFYGEETLEKLAHFISDKGISDLHSGNIGYSLENEPCLIDFSGYDD